MISLDPVVKKLFDDARQLKASDIHLEPMLNGVRVRFRVAGQLICADKKIPDGLKQSLVAKLKVMAGLDSTQRMIPQDGALRLGNMQGRLSTVPVLEGESVVIRLFDHVGELESLDNLGLVDAQIATLKTLLKHQWGLLIISGPTGSGKTTSFYASLRQIDPAAQKIITVEDPVEQHLPGATQVPVGSKASFSSALRSILRHSPNVIGVGEIRDSESAAMALQASLTGHLVVATLHADSVVGVVMRLRELGVSARMLAEVLRGVSSQRLVSQRLPDGTRQTRGVFEVAEVSEELADAIRADVPVEQLCQVLESESFADLQTVAQQIQLPEEILMSEFNLV